jgi:hypothetical protein
LVITFLVIFAVGIATICGGWLWQRKIARQIKLGQPVKLPVHVRPKKAPLLDSTHLKKCREEYGLKYGVVNLSDSEVEKLKAVQDSSRVIGIFIWVLSVFFLFVVWSNDRPLLQVVLVPLVTFAFGATVICWGRWRQQNIIRAIKSAEYSPSEKHLS